MDINPLVSIVIPSKNSDKVLESCLKHIQSQTYKNIETIVVDSHSTDKTLDICKRYEVKVAQFTNPTLQGRFDATFKRNLGAKNARGDFVYYLDADFELTPNVVGEAVEACTEGGFDGVIVKEEVKGQGFWTACRGLEQECYWGDDNVEAPRFYKRAIWEKLEGLDSSLGAGCDDWDLYQRFLKQGFKATRIKAPLTHNERKITLSQTARKAFLYGRDVSKFVKKSPMGGFIYFFPIRPAYLHHWRLFVKNPLLGLGLIFLRCLEYAAGALGIIANAGRKYGKILA